MYNLDTRLRLDSAHAVFAGRHGDVTRLAQQRGCCRQALYRQAHDVAVAIEGAQHQRQLQELKDQVRQLTLDVENLRRQSTQTVLIDHDKQAHFAATASALGVSLSAAHTLLAVLLPTKPLSVPTLGRRVQEVAAKATAVLSVLDEFSRRRARHLAADEMYVGRQPALIVIEQHSLCWLGGRLASCCDGQQWAQEFRLYPAAEQVARDGGQGLGHGLAVVNRERAQLSLPAIADQADHFHILFRGGKALTQVMWKAIRAFRTADQAQQKLDVARRKGTPMNGYGAAVARWWVMADAAFTRWSAQSACFEGLTKALRLFTPEGVLNTRAQAQASVQEALTGLTGPEWKRIHTRLVGPKAFTFLDRVHEQLARVTAALAGASTPASPAAAGGVGAKSSVGPSVVAPAVGPEVSSQAAELVSAAVRLEWMRRNPEALRGDGSKASALRGLMVVLTVALSSAGSAGVWVQSQVSDVLRSAWRSSSLVEGLNSVLRMHQRRQKRVTQGLLDLKRVAWNMHVFRAGRRRRQSPYERLGLKLPCKTWWELLQMPPDELRRQMSALNPAA